MSKEAMKLALEALESCGAAHITDGGRQWYDEKLVDTAYAALQEALAEQSEQQREPFAYYFETYSYEGQKSTWFVACPCDGKLNGKPGIPLYTSPPAQRTWVGLTDDEIYSVLENLQVMYNRPPTTDSRIIFARAIEAKLKEKNT